MMKINNRSLVIDIVFLILISALTYLPNVLALGYYRDDWYYMYDGLVAGPDIFNIMFEHLRPARGPFYSTLFSIFGNFPLPYHLTSFLWRLLGGFAMFWLFDLLWPKRRSARFFTALMFTIYPGYLWWVAGVEYQPMVFGLGIHVLSIAASLKAINTLPTRLRIFWYLFSIVSGWYALALVDYAIGMELFRLMGVFLLVQRRMPEGSLKDKTVRTVTLAAPFILIPVTFLLWRQIFFENWRKATDVSLQLGAIFSSLNLTLWFLVRLIQSMLNVSIFAWFVPFTQLFFASRLRELMIGFAIAFSGVVLALFAEHSFKSITTRKGDNDERWTIQAVVLGLLGTIAGILPVVLGNRLVSFSRFSHYALPASVAAVLFLTGLVFSIKDNILKKGVMGLLITLAILTHHGLAVQAKTERKLINDFWWQMSWRAPDLQSGALLLVEYPFGFADDIDVVYGPANYIYYPEKQPASPVQMMLSAEVVGGSTAVDVLMGKKERSGNYYGAHEYSFSYDNVLIISYPTTRNCVRIFDPRWPNFSIYDRDWILQTAENSNIDNVLVSGSRHFPPEYLFGPEPERDWCYYYQKADLARQIGDWEAIVALHKESRRSGYTPNDQIELIPFLQAYAYLGDFQSVKKISTIINSERWYKFQACQVLRGMSDQGFALEPEMNASVDKLFCD
jgi:hypothetical protein